MKDIRLYINEKRVDLDQNPGINYNWTETDITNPVVTKVGYSKTITLPGTKNNNIIFGQFWNLEHYQTYDGAFNPSYRVPFVLYVDGSIFEKGYVKLQKVTKTNGKYTYEVGLFGGLGNFLYNISTDWASGEKKTLGSLQYYAYPIADTGAEYEDLTTIDLGFTINKSTVNNAWNGIWNAGSKWRAINFAPCYNGLSDKMDTDKAVVNMNDISVFQSGVTSGGTAYTAYNGWALAKLPRKCTEWETKDLRCWAQRPVVRAKYIIDAISRKANNTGKYDNGYEVVLDEEFFKHDNPYYTDAFMTLPLLTDLNYNTEGATSSAYTSNYSTYYNNSTNNSEDNVTFVFTLPSAITKFGCSVTANFDFFVKVTGTTASTLYTGCEVGYPGGSRRFLNGYAIQMFASSMLNSDDGVLAASKTKWLGSDETRIISGYPVKAVWPPTVEECKSNGSYTSIDDTTPVEIETGNFVKYGNNGLYRWNKAQSLTCDLPVGTRYFKINIQKVSSVRGAGGYLFPQVVMGNNQAFNTPSRYDFTNKNTFDNRTIRIYIPGQNQFYTNKVVKQSDILSTDYTPADWLMAYCKMFGLYLHKDPIEDKIYIDTRKTFYNRLKVTDITKNIDYSKDMEITPLVADYKYYSMKNDLENSGAAKNYFDKYGKTYGMKIIDTGYEFNADTEDIISIPLKGAVEVRDKGPYYFKPVSGINPYVYDGTSYTLYKNGNYSGDTIDINIDKLEISSYFEPFDSAYTSYDITDRPQFCDDERKPVNGANVLLFWLGDTPGVTSNMNYILTDDLDVMSRLNNAPCYIITNSDEDIALNPVCIQRSSIPRFSRYWTPGTQRKITYSMDFGNPRQLYVPNIYDTERNTLYYNFYRTYLEDLYDVNTKVLSCYLHMPNTLTGEDIRQFYWFDNSLWRLNRIIDNDPSSGDSVKVELIKVQHLDSITSEDVTTNTWGIITPSQMVIPASGGTFTISVETSDGMGFSVEGASDEITYTPSYRNADGDITLTFEPNNSGSGRTLGISFSWGDTGGGATFYQDSSTYEFSVSASTTSLASGATTGTITVNNPNNYYWTVTDTPSWMVVNKFVGDSSDTITFNTEANSTTSARTGTFEILESDYNNYYSINFTQAAGAKTLSVSSTAITANSGSTTTGFNIITNYPSGTWSISAPSWVTVLSPSPASGVGSQSVTIYIQTNTGSSRSDVITVNSYFGAPPATVTVTQAAGTGSTPKVTFNNTGIITPGNWGWTGWFIERVIVSEYSNWEDAQADNVFEQIENVWMEYGDSPYTYMGDSYVIDTPESWKGQTKTFYIFIEAVNDGGTLGQYIRGTKIQTINSNTNTTITLPNADSGWYGPYSS